MVYFKKNAGILFVPQFNTLSKPIEMGGSKMKRIKRNISEKDDSTYPLIVQRKFMSDPGWRAQHSLSIIRHFNIVFRWTALWNSFTISFTGILRIMFHLRLFVFNHGKITPLNFTFIKPFIDSFWEYLKITQLSTNRLGSIISVEYNRKRLLFKVRFQSWF